MRGVVADGQQGSVDKAGASRGEQVYQRLIARIRTGSLKPGTRLREEDLASMLEVSRTPVREALGRLQARGLVAAVQGGLSVVELSRHQTMELYALRAMLEGAAARFAAENASPSDQAALQHVAQRFAACQGTPSEFADANKLFHDMIVEAAHNGYLTRMLEELNDSLALLPDTTFSVAGRSTAALGEHEAILAAIIAREPDRAEAAARSHIARARDARLELLFRASGGPTAVPPMR